MSPAPFVHSLPLLLLLLAATCWAVVVGAFIQGVTAQCSNEGDAVEVPNITTKELCISCSCKNKEVICKKESCSEIVGCYFILADHREKCCEVCKGCSYKGDEWRSSSQWTDPQDPCISYTCQASVLTKSRIQCYTPCKNPLPPATGECCPKCQGCLFRDARYKEGDVFPLEEDRCVICSCMGGSITCSKRSCPVLTCPDNKTVLRPDSCCPECKGTRKLYVVENKCLLQSRIYKSGSPPFRLDDCTTCECQNTTSVCERRTCPPLTCPVQFQATESGNCCATCRKEEQKRRCIVEGNEYKDGETWKLDECSNCICQYGQLRCSVQQCQLEESKDCPLNHRKQKLPGECCTQCIENDAVCTVFGDPHYRTFDGRVFNFQGPCKYMLAEDCKNKTFSIRVRNDDKSTRSFSWTKTVFFKVGKTKVTLEQRMRVKVNQHLISMPHNEPGLTISREGYSILVSATQIGVRIIWDGDNFLEISVPTSYKNQLCGLCGNYNSKQADDFQTRQGEIKTDPKDFGAAWQVGNARQCARHEPTVLPNTPCHAQWGANNRAFKECSLLKTPVFARCHDKVSPLRYLKSCMIDMCECPKKRRCYCDALTAYAHECSRFGIDIDWRNQTKCGGINCPKGAVFESCGPACVKTCRNWRTFQLCMKPCIAGCQCPAGTVRHRNKCIKPRRCPRILISR